MEKIEKHIKNSQFNTLHDFLIHNGASETMNVHKLMKVFTYIGKITDNEVLFLARDLQIPRYEPF